MREEDLYQQLARYLNLKHPRVPYHFDQSGMWTSSHKARNLYSRLNQKAWPDLLIATPRYMAGTEHFFGGLFLELKRDGTRLKKRDGSWSTIHIEEQAAVLERLSTHGYCALFAVGFEEATTLIDSYLTDGVAGRAT